MYNEANIIWEYGKQGLSFDDAVLLLKKIGFSDRRDRGFSMEKYAGNEIHVVPTGDFSMSIHVDTHNHKTRHDLAATKMVHTIRKKLLYARV